MINAAARRATGVVIGTALVVGMLSGCVGGLSVFGGCTDRDEQLGAILADLPILSAHPASAMPTDKSSGCDADDGFAYASQQYRTDLDRERIVSFYRAAAAEDGWRPDGANPAPVPSDGLVISAGVACFVRDVDGTPVYLMVWFPSDLNIPDEPELQASNDLYGLDVKGARYCTKLSGRIRVPAENVP